MTARPRAARRRYQLHIAGELAISALIALALGWCLATAIEGVRVATHMEALD